MPLSWSLSWSSWSWSSASSSSPSSSSSSPTLPGLANLGNTCFMNAVLQSLNATRPLARLLAPPTSPPCPLDPDASPHLSEPKHLATRGLPVLDELTRLFCQLSTDLGALKPEGILTSIAAQHPEYRRNEEQDAHEFLHILMDLVRSEQAALLNRAVHSRRPDASVPHTLPRRRQSCSASPSSSGTPPSLLPLDSLFEGSLTQYTVCERLHVSSVPEGFLDLSLATQAPPPPSLTKRANLCRGIQRRLRSKTPRSGQSESDEVDAGWHQVLLGGSSAPSPSPLTRLHMSSRCRASPALLLSTSLGAPPQLPLNPYASSESLPKTTRAQPDLLAHILSPTPHPALSTSAPTPCSGLRALRSSHPNPLLARVGWSPSTPAVDSTGLEALLRSFTAVERLDGDNRFACEACGAEEARLSSGSLQPEKQSASSVVLRRAWRRYMITRLPPVVVVHLKRIEGCQPFISFPLKLDFRPYLCHQGAAAADGRLYGLYAVVVHRALRLGGGGHYFAYVLSNRTGSGAGRSWLYCSDAEVRKAAVEEVLKSTAYLLFYEKL